MILELDFFYSGENNYFEYLLHFYAKNYEYFLEKSHGKYTLKIKGEEKELKKFCDDLNYISSSVFLRNFKLNLSEEFSEKSSFEISKFSKFPYITHLNSSAFTQNKELIENEWGIFCECEFSLDNLKFESINKQNFNELLTKALNQILSKKSIFIKDKNGIYELFFFDNDFMGDFLLASDIKSCTSIFVCQNEILRLLASLEKPLISLRINALYRNKFKIDKKDFKLCLARNLFSFALGFELFKQDIKFLNVKKVKEFNKDFELLNFSELVILQGFDFFDENFKELIFSKDDKNMARISYLISIHKNALILELSKDYDDLLIIKENNFLKLFLPKNSQELFAEISKDETGAKLLSNFKQKFKLFKADFKLKNNFYSLFGIIALILGLDDEPLNAVEKLLQMADESKLLRGVKIDFSLKDDKSFDYARCVRSVMSFMLAGVQSENIAYGVLESLAYFLRDTYDELRAKKLCESAIISGSLFENKALLKNTLKHLRNCELSDVALRI